MNRKSILCGLALVGLTLLGVVGLRLGPSVGLAKTRALRLASCTACGLSQGSSLRQTLLKVVGIVLLVVSAVPASARTNWMSSIPSALKEARASGRPLLIDISVDWCPWCQKLESDVYPDGVVQEALHRFVDLRLDGDSNGSGVANQYHVQGYPTILVIDANGRLVGTIGGYEDAPRFAADLNSLADRFTQSGGGIAQPPLNRSSGHVDLISTMRTRLNENPNDTEAAFVLGMGMIGSGNRDGIDAPVNKLISQGNEDYAAMITNGLGDHDYHAGAFKKAIADYEWTLALKINEAERLHANLWLACCYAKSNQNSLAETRLKSIISSPTADAGTKNRAQADLNLLDQGQPISPV